MSNVTIKANAGQIWWVDFGEIPANGYRPFTKKRPVLIISNEDYCMRYGEYQCVLLTTSELYKKDPATVFIDGTRTGGKPRYALCWKITTVSNEELISYDSCIPIRTLIDVLKSVHKTHEFIEFDSALPSYFMNKDNSNRDNKSNDSCSVEYNKPKINIDKISSYNINDLLKLYTVVYHDIQDQRAQGISLDDAIKNVGFQNKNNYFYFIGKCRKRFDDNNISYERSKQSLSRLGCKKK